MARIRTVKPELFLHEDLYDLEVETGLPIRLAWIGLFCIADREGRFEWRPRKIKAQILPYDKVDFGALLSALEGRGFIRSYGDNQFGVIPTFKNHQVVNVREAQSSIPAPPKEICIEGGKRSRVVPAENRREVHARARTCEICGSDSDLTIDHIVPFSKGGGHEVENLRILCRSCNSSKSDGEVHAHENNVHARGEGKGREQEGNGNGKEREQDSSTVGGAADDEIDFGLGKPVRERFEVLDPFKDEPDLSEVLCFISSAVQRNWAARYDHEWIKAALRNAIQHHLAKENASESSQINDWGVRLVKWVRNDKKPRLKANTKSERQMIEEFEAELQKNGEVNHER